MFQRVEVIRAGVESGLDRHVWTFSYYELGHALVLDSYRFERRASSRHKFRTVQSYFRLKGQSVYADGWGERLAAPPPCSADIFSEARCKFAQSLDVRLALEKKGGGKS